MSSVMHGAPATSQPGAAASNVSRAARVLAKLVLGYQWVRQARPSPCRFVPTCSNFALEALERHGAVRGAWYSLRRLGRCHPWGGSGLDPVPDRKCSRC